MNRLRIRVRQSRDAHAWDTELKRAVERSKRGDQLRQRRDVGVLPQTHDRFYFANLAGSRSKSSETDSARYAAICACRSAIFCSVVAMASAPAINRRGGGSKLAIVRSACASFAGSPDCLPF